MEGVLLIEPLDMKEFFMKKVVKVDIMLTIESFSAPGYIKRDDSITVYVEEALLDQLKERAEELGVKRNTIMIQAIKNYCTYHGKEIGIKFDWSF